MSIQLTKTSPVREWLQGVCDTHVYCKPDVYLRQFDEIEMARQFRDWGYRAWVSKRHHMCNADAVYYANQTVPGVKTFGGVVLNWTVGGLNPMAVDAAIMFGAKVIWMGNMHAGTLSTQPFRTRYGYDNVPEDSPWKARPTKKWMVRPPINVIDLEKGELLPVVYDILDLIADADILLETCHISTKECFAIVPAARKAEVKKIAITHPNITDPERTHSYWSIEDLIRITNMGALLEHNAGSYVRRFKEAKICAESIKKVGADRCVMVSGQGVLKGVHPIEAMRLFILEMRRNGISEKETDMMTKDNPAKLLGLE